MSCIACTFSACLLGAVFAAAATDGDAVGPILLTSYRAQAVAVGTENEDWEPAFRAALADCAKTGRPLRVPAGIYKIRKAVGYDPKVTLDEALARIIAHFER